MEKIIGIYKHAGKFTKAIFLTFSPFFSWKLAERNSSQDVIGNMLSCPELLVASVKESILDAGGIFNRHIVVDDEQDAGRQHPLLGRQLDQDVFAPDVRVSHGRPTIFIPTKAIIATVQVLHFFLENHISMILIGARGCGKSLSLSKVVPHLSTGWTVKYLLLGGIFKLHTFKILTDTVCLSF